ncbi:oxygenase MpaB family protein [uncultured Mucilaginibacter sp.]|uniref:oxygenase MpaB family protein n=1 Tax=uncultured Mucilaginibacter sp. TaxID=797541 RepID=UPI0025DA4759|nr:oxygenase MpaB family protein [uncultured Mucilaginibacter sp.]
MKYFVSEDSIVRSIWGKADTVLFIFAGAAAEFALNKAVDWLYFTGNLPADPLARLFSTVEYSKKILFSKYDDALWAIDKITAIHKGVETARGMEIPQWAYRDVLYLLIDYSVRSFELLERKLTDNEKRELYDVFYRLGKRMQIQDLPQSYSEWIVMRENHLKENLVCSTFTIDLYRQYRKHLGTGRYLLLKQVQMLLVPNQVFKLLNFNSLQWLGPVLGLYKLAKQLKLDWLLKEAILPPKYKLQIKGLDN